MVRPALEVADILRDHGPAWREANQGHVSLEQLKVMRAIAAMSHGGARRGQMSHAAKHHRRAAIPRSRTTPAATGIAQSVRARRRADGSPTAKRSCCPIPYFHVVYTLPSELRAIAYQNKRVVYNLLMKAAAETTLALARDPKRLGARNRVSRCSAHLGLGAHPSSARAYDRAGRRALARRRPTGRLPLQLPRPCRRPGAPVPGQDARDAHAMRTPPAS